MSSRLRTTLSLVLLGVVCLAAYWYVRTHSEDFQAVELVSWPAIGLVAVCFGFNIAFRGLFSLFVLRAVRVDLTFLESFQLSAVATMTNFVLPFRSGTGLRALYLKRCYGLELTLFASTMTALYIFFIFVNCLLGMVALLLLTALHDPTSLKLFAILACLGLASGWAIFLAPDVPRGDGRLLKYLSRISEGWDQIRSSRPILVAALSTTAGTSFFASLGLYSAFQAFGLDIGPGGSILLMASQNVGGLIGITPGAAGFQEGAGLLFSSVLSVTVAETLLVLGVARLVKIGVALVLGVPSTMMLSKRLAVGDGV